MTSTVHKLIPKILMRAVVNIQSTLYLFDIGEICDYLTLVEVVLAFFLFDVVTICNIEMEQTWALGY